MKRIFILTLAFMMLGGTMAYAKTELEKIKLKVNGEEIEFEIEEQKYEGETEYKADPEIIMRFPEDFDGEEEKLYFRVKWETQTAEEIDYDDDYYIKPKIFSFVLPEATGEEQEISLKLKFSKQEYTEDTTYSLWLVGGDDYDDVIVEYYNKYGSCLLYKFTDKDTYWTPSGWMNGVLGVNGKAGYLATPADEKYVGEQLDLIQKLWFSSYSAEFLKEFLPMKIMLCSEIDSLYVTWDFSVTPMQMVYLSKDVRSWYNYDNICVGYGDIAVTQMTKKDSSDFRSRMNRIFVESMIGRGKTAPTKEFGESANYNISSSDMYTASKLWAAGIPQLVNYSISESNDWKTFLLMMVLSTEEFLTRVPEYNNNWDSTSKNWDGILNPVKDVNGLLKKRYDMVRNYFIENYNMDLQKVGNTLKR